MKLLFIVVILFASAIGMLVFVVSSAQADHFPGLNEARSESNTLCCGDQNCVIADVTRIGPGKVIVNGTYIEMSDKAIHPNKYSTPGFWCFPPGAAARCTGIFTKDCAFCVFYPPGQG